MQELDKDILKRVKACDSEAVTSLYQASRRSFLKSKKVGLFSIEDRREEEHEGYFDEAFEEVVRNIQEDKYKVMLLAPKLHRVHRTGNFTKNSDAACIPIGLINNFCRE